jgi:PAS domain S-box-containing protein
VETDSTVDSKTIPPAAAAAAAQAPGATPAATPAAEPAAAPAFDTLKFGTDFAEASSDTLRALLAAIVESSEDAIVSKTLDGIVTSWNAAAERLFGYTAAEAVGCSITLIIPAERQHEEQMILRRLRRGERIEHYETVRQAKDGHPIEVSITVSPIRDGGGRIVGASKVARDITLRKRSEAALRDLGRRKDEFLAILSHELRNPLAPILNAAQVLLRAPASEQQVQWAAQLVDRQAQHMARLIDELMDLSRINTGKVSLHKTPMELSAAVHAAVDSCRPRIDSAGHRLDVTLPREPLLLEADGDRLIQVFSNLLDNAAKYSDPGGHIWLTVSRDGDAVDISVRDAGIGIPAERIATLFGMYMQGDEGPAQARDGLGIGLTIANRLVQMHGGQLTVASAGSGHGSEFVVRLPLLQSETPAPVAAPANRGDAGRTAQRVLIVDDNEDAADSLALLLEDAGHETEAVYDGEAALEAAARLRPQVVLLDLGLPTLSGFDVAQQLRHAHGSDFLLIAVTGWGQDRDRQSTRDAGFDLHLTKPLDFGTLLDVVDRHAGAVQA